MAAIIQTTFFAYFFFNENHYISIKISQKYVRKCPIDKNLVLVPTMAWRQTGDKPLSELMIAWFGNGYPGLDDLMIWIGGHPDKLVMSTCCGTVLSYGIRLLVQHYIDSVKGLSPVKWQAITQTNADFQLIVVVVFIDTYRSRLRVNVTPIIIFQSGLRFRFFFSSSNKNSCLPDVSNSKYPLYPCHEHDLTNSSTLKLIENCGCRFQQGNF